MTRPARTLARLALAAALVVGGEAHGYRRALSDLRYDAGRAVLRAYLRGAWVGAASCGCWEGL